MVRSNSTPLIGDSRGVNVEYDPDRAFTPNRVEKEAIHAKKKHLRGASSKEQRQYEHIKKKAQRSGRYGKRAKEVAARTVMKHHKAKKRQLAGLGSWRTFRQAGAN
jgi:hypothetical protein